MYVSIIRTNEIRIACPCIDVLFRFVQFRFAIFALRCVPVNVVLNLRCHFFVFFCMMLRCVSIYELMLQMAFFVFRYVSFSFNIVWRGIT